MQPQAPKGPYPRSIAFSEEEHAQYFGEGNAEIDGQVFLKTMGGDVKYGAGETVTLVPETPYFKADALAFMQDRAISTKDLDAAKLKRTTQTNGQGEFKFVGIPAGKYYVFSQVYWMAPTGYGGNLQRQGNKIFKSVTVDANSTTDVMVTY